MRQLVLCLALLAPSIAALPLQAGTGFSKCSDPTHQFTLPGDFMAKVVTTQSGAWYSNFSQWWSVKSQRSKQIFENANVTELNMYLDEGNGTSLNYEVKGSDCSCTRLARMPLKPINQYDQIKLCYEMSDESFDKQKVHHFQIVVGAGIDYMHDEYFSSTATGAPVRSIEHGQTSYQRDWVFYQPGDVPDSAFEVPKECANTPCSST